MVCSAICDDNEREAGTAEKVVRNCCQKEEKVCESRVFCNSKALLYEVE